MEYYKSSTEMSAKAMSLNNSWESVPKVHTVSSNVSGPDPKTISDKNVDPTISQDHTGGKKLVERDLSFEVSRASETPFSRDIADPYKFVSAWTTFPNKDSKSRSVTAGHFGMASQVPRFTIPDDRNSPKPIYAFNGSLSNDQSRPHSLSAVADPGGFTRVTGSQLIQNEQKAAEDAENRYQDFRARHAQKSPTALRNQQDLSGCLDSFTESDRSSAPEWNRNQTQIPQPLQGSSHILAPTNHEPHDCIYYTELERLRMEYEALQQENLQLSCRLSQISLQALPSEWIVLHNLKSIDKARRVPPKGIDLLSINYDLWNEDHNCPKKTRFCTRMHRAG